MKKGCYTELRLGKASRRRYHLRTGEGKEACGDLKGPLVQRPGGRNELL